MLGIFNYRSRRGGSHMHRKIKLTHSAITNERVHRSDVHTGRFIYNLIYPKVCNISSPKSLSFNFGLVNPRSVCNKISMTLDHILENNLDLCLFTETWITQNDDVSRGKLNIPGFKFLDHPRERRTTGGGTGILCRSTLTVSTVSHGDKISFEYSVWDISFKNTHITFAVIYRVPYSQSHPVPLSDFFEEFEELLCEFHNISAPIILCGDFNLHINKPDDPDGQRFISTMDSYGYTQHVNFPTHMNGNTLDLIFTRDSDNISVLNISEHDFISDHCFVHCNIALPSTALELKQFSYRKFKNIDFTKMQTDITESSFIQEPSEDVSALASQYESCLSSILDKHAPLKTKVIAVRPTIPWYSDELQSLKSAKRRHERAWRLDKSAQNRILFIKARDEFARCYRKAADNHYENVIASCDGNSKKLFGVIKSLLNQPDKSHPPISNNSDIANEIMRYFSSKVIKIREDLDAVDCDYRPSDYLDESYCLNPFTKFKCLTEIEVSKLVTSCSSASCSLDPMPTKIIKLCHDSILPGLTNLINTSLTSGTFAKSWKNALISPLLKKVTAPPSVDNLRPISNLQFVSKLVEKAAMQQLIAHCHQNCPLPSHQSAYRQNYSTETALLKIHSDIMQALDQGNIALMILLDMSAAFDTVDHAVLLEILNTKYGVSGSALNWFSSYLSDRTQSVSLHGIHSDPICVDYGVPQGSCLGPLCFSIYTSSLFSIIQKHLTSCYSYADDTQLIHVFKPNGTESESAAISQLESCIHDIRIWMIAHKLKMNDAKTEFVIIGSNPNLSKVNINSIQIGDTHVASSKMARNLGVMFDSRMSMEDHVKKVCKTGNYYLYNLRKVRKHMSSSAMQKLVTAFIHTHLDYCNSLLYGIPNYLLNRLQRLQNNAAKLVFGTFEVSSTYALNHLHWLPVAYRIQFKILLFVFKCLQNRAPPYLSDHIIPVNNNRYSLRSNNSFLLTVPITKRKSFGNRSFYHAGPILWNKLPFHLRSLTNINSFKSGLKTHLFRVAYS